MDENIRKGESILTRFGVIKKTWVCCYDVIIFDSGWDVHQKEVKNLIIIGIDKESIKNSVGPSKHAMEGFTRTKKYKLKSSKEIYQYELVERFNLTESQIEEILSGEDLELSYYDLCDTDYFYECRLTIEQLRDKRKKDTEHFDSKEALKKIIGDVNTPRKAALLIDELKKKYLI